MNTNQRLFSSIFCFCLLAGSLDFTACAYADLSTLMKESGNELSVIIPVAQSDDDDYGLLTIPREALVSQLELIHPDWLENAYFKVVENSGDDVLSIDDFDGRNVLYHLMIARKHYLQLAEHAGTPLKTLHHKIVVRVRVNHGFNPSLHFNAFNDYNNSRYIPSDSDGGWSNEIWFDRRKAIMDKIDWYGLNLAIGGGIFTKNWLALANPIPDLVNKYNSGIDAAKIPNVIYHETFHWASDDDTLLPMPAAGNQIGEDYANYFGSSITGRPEIAEIHEFSGRFYRENYKKIHEVKDDGNVTAHPTLYNASRFVPSLFWSIRDRIGADRADQLFWNSLVYLKGGFFHTRVPEAVLRAAHEDEDLAPGEVAFIEQQMKRYSQSFVNLQKRYYGNMPIDPGETSPELLAAAESESAQIREIPLDLKNKGIDISDDDAKKFTAFADQMDTQTKKPGLVRDVVHFLVKAGEFSSYSISAISGALNAPVRFGSEFVVSATTGRSMEEYHHEKVLNQFVGSGGGLVGLYYLDVGLNLISNPLPVQLSLTGATLVEGLICSHAKTTKKVELKKYCEENTKIISSMNEKIGKAGDESGEKTRSFFSKIKNLFK